MSEAARPTQSLPPVDVAERGAGDQVMHRRLFMQLSVFRGSSSGAHALPLLQQTLERVGKPAVVYQDMSDPHAFGLLLWSEQPKDIIDVRQQISDGPELTGHEFVQLFSMLGRTYSSGYERDLEYWLLRRPAETVCNAEWPWAIWYPLRRGGAFEQLSTQEQGSILREHAMIGRAYGEKDLAHDVRLACHGLDRDDNDFVIGLVGKELHPLSHVVQHMRKTRQTSEFLEKLGPFFIGYAVWQFSGS